MHILRQTDLSQFKQPTAVSIGSFDGIHKGHQFILKTLKEIALKNNLVPVVIFFEPQPKEFFLKEKGPKRLTHFRDKIKLLEAFNIKTVLVLRFNESLKNINAELFIKKILLDGLHMKHILVGDDFRFGKNQLGDVHLLKIMAIDHAYKIDKIETYFYQDKRVSSSIIRGLINQGNFKEANAYLGYDYFISGRVTHGDKNGRKLGFPTINILLKQQMAVSGVYVVNVIIGNKTHQGVANVGIRPTTNGLKRLLEVYIFDYDDNAYDKMARVIFLHWLRNEVKFTSFDDLKAQIKKDVKEAKLWLLDHSIELT